MATGSRKTSVELFETDGAEEELFAAEPASPAPRSWRRVLGRAWPLALAVLVLAGAFVVVKDREARRTEARLEVLLGQPAFVEDLGPELGWRWEVPLGVSEWILDSIDGALLVQRPDDRRVRALDLESGSELWSLPGVTSGLDQWCGTSGDLVQCQFWEFSDRAGGDVELVEPRLLRTELRDARTGEVLVSREGQPAERVEVWGDSVLVLDRTPGRSELRRESLTGEQLWRVRVPEAESLFAWVDEEHELAFLYGDRHLVVDGDGTVLLELDSGLEDDEWLSAVDEQTFVRGRWSRDAPRGEFLGIDGQVLSSFEGDFEIPSLDDGEVPHLVMISPAWGAELRDFTTGETLVEVDGRPEGGPFLLDGALVYLRQSELRAVDLLSGKERWTTTVHRGELLGSDGRVLLYRDRFEGVLAAYSLRTGVLEWTFEIPSASLEVHAVGGALFLVGDGRLIRLGTVQ